jgi:hypothetical protein
MADTIAPQNQIKVRRHRTSIEDTEDSEEPEPADPFHTYTYFRIAVEEYSRQNVKQKSPSHLNRENRNRISESQNRRTQESCRVH